MLMLMFLAPRAGPVSDRACKYKVFLGYMYMFSFVGADDGRLAKNMPAGCIVRSSVIGKFFVRCVGFSGILTLIVADWTFHES